MAKKYIDDLIEDYLDDGKEYYDYHTASYNGDGNVIDSKHTGMSFYDQFLGTAELDYLREKKNLVGKIVKMTPREYYEICAYKIFNTTVAQLQKERGVYDRKIIDKLHNVINVYKRKLCMPMINYADNGQEGLHRMLAVAELFGWDHEVPVLIVDWYDKNRAQAEANAKIQAEIDLLVERSIKETLHYYFVDIEDLSIQLQSELEKQFKYKDNIKIPEVITLKEQTTSFVFIFNNKQYEIYKEDIKWREESDDNDIDFDIDDLEVDEDFLIKYFGDDWKSTYPHLEDTFNIKESVDTNEIDSNIIKEILENHNHCYYQDSSMALELICEKLFYEYNIDARYKGRSIYVGDKKIATIKVDREGPGMLGMYGYSLFI